MTFQEMLEDGRPHVFDGAMGTQLYLRGVGTHVCFDELCASQPGLVRAVHLSYLEAGAELLETNSFGANPVKLAHYGLESRCEEINVHAARVAREAAAGKALVAGSVGPLGIRIEPYGPTSEDEASGYFAEQVKGLLEGGVDLFILETFSDLAEIRQAIRAVRGLCDLPIICQMTIQDSGATAYGTSPELCARRLDQWGADVIGLNCSVGPHGILSAVEKMAAATEKKLSAQPNAGLPRQIQGRQLYMASPEYVARYAQLLISSGVKFVGGCCGTTPEHIKRVADAVYAMSPGRTRIRTSSAAAEATSPATPAVPLAERSQWGRKLAAGELTGSVEIVPPKGGDPSALLAGAKLLQRAGVDAVNVPDGPRAQMRMSVLATATLIEQLAGIETIVHYCCRDRNLLGMLSDLLGAHGLGLRNLLLITGDPPRMGPYPEATAVFDIDSIGLTNLVSRLNRGLDPGGNSLGSTTRFTIGVGLNPGAPDIDHELNRFYWKVDAGAEYAFTQPIFDADQLLECIEELRRREIWIPVVAGIWPLVSLRNAEFLANEVPGVEIPDHIVERMRRVGGRGKEHALAEGQLIAREILERVQGEIQGIQVSAPFGNVGLALPLLDCVPGVDANLANESPSPEDAEDASEDFGFVPPGRHGAAPVAPSD